jgi:hypothetical protein
MKLHGKYLWAAIAVAAVVGISALAASHYYLSPQSKAMRCLHDADCQKRLAAAMNEVYAKAGYDGPHEIMSTSTQDDMSDVVLEAFAESHANAVADVGDQAFWDYVSGPLQDICPFYEPDGVSYRSCLSSHIESEKMAFKGSRASITEFEKYCDSVSAKYTGIEAVNLDLSCLAFKLRAI